MAEAPTTNAKISVFDADKRRWMDINDLDVNSYYPEPPFSLSDNPVWMTAGDPTPRPEHYTPPVGRITFPMLKRASAYIDEYYRFVRKPTRKQRRLTAQMVRRNARNALAVAADHLRGPSVTIKHKSELREQ